MKINIIKILYNLYWITMYLIYLINKFIEYPYIFITHLILIYLYIKIYNKKKKKIIKLITIPLILIIFKKIIKNILFINRPYKKILNYEKILIYIPIWLIKYWNNKIDSSFPSGHTIYSFFWILNFKNKIYKWYIKLILILLLIIITSRMLLFLHNIEDIIFSILVNIIFKKIYTKI